MAFRGRVKFRSRPKFMQAILGVCMLALYGLVATKLLDAIAVALNQTTTPFSAGFGLLGFSRTGDLLTGTVSSSGLIGVLFIVAAAAVIISAFVKLNQRKTATNHMALAR